MIRTKINEQIAAAKVRLISQDGKQLGVVNFKQALHTARSQSLDLVLMTADANPPVCKILDFKKHVFDKKKQQGQAKRNHKRTILKEIKFRPDTEDGDYKVKTKRLVKFLTGGDRAKVTIRFRGREVVYKERGYDMLKRIENDLGNIAEVEQQSKLEGKLLITVFKPISGKLNKAKNKAGKAEATAGTSGTNKADKTDKTVNTTDATSSADRQADKVKYKQTAKVATPQPRVADTNRPQESTPIKAKLTTPKVATN